jgi:hypothetical protein
MNLIDIDSLELARYSVIEVEVDLGIQIIEDSSRNPNNNQNGGYQKVNLVDKSDPSKHLATIIIHHAELAALEALLNE